MNRNPRSTPGRRPNPLSDLVAEKKRSAEIARQRQRAEQLSADLPAIISDHVGEHIQKLETKLLKDFQQMGQKAIEESTNVLNETLNGRIETLEQISALQSKTIVNLRDSSRIAEQKVSTVVNSIEKTLSDAVPGFRLEPSAFAVPLISTGDTAQTAGSTGTQIVKADSQEVEEIKLGKNGYCPKCTSTHVRRANRTGLFEEFLRLFFIAPFRCRACRHKFYRF
ncbi:MAG TPA: hypothetical protein VG273_01550 [Bryobacteraceae bacterium]|nr:hypothetical protein [Bryobacteraceae bacterium]